MNVPCACALVHYQVKYKMLDEIPLDIVVDCK